MKIREPVRFEKKVDRRTERQRMARNWISSIDYVSSGAKNYFPTKGPWKSSSKVNPILTQQISRNPLIPEACIAMQRLRRKSLIHMCPIITGRQWWFQAEVYHRNVYLEGHLSQHQDQQIWSNQGPGSISFPHFAWMPVCLRGKPSDIFHDGNTRTAQHHQLKATSGISPTTVQ